MKSWTVRTIVPWMMVLISCEPVTYPTSEPFHGAWSSGDYAIVFLLDGTFLYHRPAKVDGEVAHEGIEVYYGEYAKGDGYLYLNVLQYQPPGGMAHSQNLYWTWAYQVSGDTLFLAGRQYYAEK